MANVHQVMAHDPEHGFPIDGYEVAAFIIDHDGELHGRGPALGVFPMTAVVPWPESSVYIPAIMVSVPIVVELSCCVGVAT
jgi:hypothetical protein